MRKSNLSLALSAVVLSFALTACEDGPMEQLGETVDETATDAGNAVEDSCEKLKEDLNASDTNC